MVLFRAAALVQQNRGPSVPNASGIPQSRSRYGQPSSRSGAPFSVRGGGLRPPQRRSGGRNTAGQGRQETGRKARQLVDRRAGASSIADARQPAHEGETGPGASSRFAPMRA